MTHTFVLMRNSSRNFSRVKCIGTVTNSIIFTKNFRTVTVCVFVLNLHTQRSQSVAQSRMQTKSSM